MTMNRTLRLTLLLPLLCASALCAAQNTRTDRQQPVNIEADRMTIDDRNKTNVFEGSVVMSQGSLEIRGDRVVISQGADGFQRGVATGNNRLATFRQKREGTNTYIEGEAERIEYDGQADLVRLIRQGELRRYRAGTLSDELTGARIVYNNATDIFTVDGAPRQPGATGGTRVRATLAPKEKPASPGAPTTEAPVLRASPELAPAPRQAP